MRIRHLATLFVAFLSTTGMQCREAADIIEQYHYVVLKPPSTLYFPGAIVAIEVNQNGEIEIGKLKLVCGPRASMGKAWSPISSQTVTENIRKSNRSTWSLKGEMLDNVKANGSGSNVDSIDVTLRNARIVNMSDTDVLENLRNRTEECKKAVNARLRAGHALTIISSAIVADMDYRVKWKSEQSVDKRVRAKQMQEIAVTLGGGHTRFSEHHIESRGLTLGIKTDSFLMSLGMMSCENDDCSYIRPDDEGQRSVGMSEAFTSDEADAPLVLPGGGYVQPMADL